MKHKYSTFPAVSFCILNIFLKLADGSMSASGSAGPGCDPRRGSKF